MDVGSDFMILSTSLVFLRRPQQAFKGDQRPKTRLRRSPSSLQTIFWLAMKLPWIGPLFSRTHIFELLEKDVNLVIGKGRGDIKVRVIGMIICE